MKKHIPIFCATDENFATFASLMMKSLLMHTNSFIEFYVMDGGIEEKTKKLIEKDLKNFSNKRIQYIDMSPYNLKRFPNSGRFARFSENAYARYFIPEIAPSLSKAIYMDVDIIVKQDVIELFDQDLKKYPIGATPCDFNIGCSMIGQVKRICPDVDINSIAFNSGILLMDIQKLIQMDFTNKAISLTEIYKDKLVYPDQDILNIIFENNYLPLDYRFDFVHSALPCMKKTKGIKTIKPLMTHYTIKPWKQNVPFQEDFEEILEGSLFYESVFKKWRAKKIRYYLFGIIPVYKKYIPKDIFFNQCFVEKDFMSLNLKGEKWMIISSLFFVFHVLFYNL